VGVPSETVPAGPEPPDHPPDFPDDVTVTRVLIVEDQRAFVESMALVIDAQRDLECVATARTGADGLEQARRHRPDVVLMDVGLPDRDGVDIARRLLRETPHTRVIILTGRPDATVLARAAAAGASAFLLKNSSIDEILDAIRATGTRRLQIDPDALVSILHSSPATAPPGVAELTQRELEVLGELGLGHQPKQIARHLGITLPTCRGYVKSLFQKIGAHSALEAVVLAHRYGIISLPDAMERPDEG
jgi:DNA-binding NarL/FixJ family response regulator